MDLEGVEDNCFAGVEFVNQRELAELDRGHSWAIRELGTYAVLAARSNSASAEVDRQRKAPGAAIG